MALLSIAFLFAFLFQQFASGLQVTPNSPCTSVCIDSNDLDYSDPNSSNTKGSDIACHDADFTSSGPGMKWQKCMSCLQSSSFSQGSENDQMWFLYNLRYSFDYCVFGFPNATNVGSNPCITSTACGGLETALKDGDLKIQGLQAYAYCDADGAAMTGDSYGRCLACVSASGDDDYIGNALVALEAGCLQRPAAGTVLGLNDTVFAQGTIGIIDPNTVPTKEYNKSSTHISTPLIAGIIAGVLVLIAAIAAFLFVRYRKRKNQEMRANPRWGRHRPKSSLSFRCQKVLSPMSPKFFQDVEDSSIDDMSEARPERRHIESKPRSGRTPPMPASSFQSLSAISLQQAPPRPMSHNNSEKKNSISGGRGPLPLRSITTNVPAVPAATHASPNATRSSPASAATTETYFNTPTSTTQLIPTGFSAYVPAEHGIASARAPAESMRSPTLINLTSPNVASPRLNQHGWPAAVREQDITFPPPPPPKGSRIDTKRTGFKKGKRESGSPVESRQIQLSFAAPPARK